MIVRIVRLAAPFAARRASARAGAWPPISPMSKAGSSISTTASIRTARNLFELIDLRMGDYIQRLLGLDPAEARRVQKGYLPRPRHHARRADGRSRRRAARLPRFRPRHRSRPDRPPIRRWSRRWTGCPGASSSSPMPARTMRGACSTGSASPTPSTACTTSTPWPMCPSPIRPLMRRSASATASIPARALFADDMVRNLAPAKAIGMTTLWVDNGSEQGPDLAEPDFVDYRIGRHRRLAGRRCMGRKWHERGARAGDRRGLGGARPARPATGGEVRDAVEEAIAPARRRRGAGRREGRRTAGPSTSG